MSVIVTSAARPLHVVMLTCQFDEILGGAEKQCALLSRKLAESGTRVTVLTSRLRWRDAAVERRGPRLKIVRLLTYAPPQLAGRWLPASYLWALQALAWIARRRSEIDILHVHQLRINAFVGAMARRTLHIPCIMKLGSSGPRWDLFTIGQSKYLFGAAGVRFVVDTADRLVATTTTIADQLRQYGIPDERINLIPNGVGLPETADSHADPPNRAAAQKRGTRCAFTGRLSPEKNILLLLEAIRELAPTTNVTLDLIGDGPLLEQAQAFIAAHDLSGRIFLHGRMADPSPVLRECDFFLLPSVWEGLSNSLLEAMGLGVIPIASGVSGARELIADGITGFLIEDASTSGGIAQTIKRALRMSAEERVGIACAAAARVRDGYDIVAVARSYQALYDELAAAPERVLRAALDASS